MITLDEMLSDLEKIHGIGCECEVCRQVSEELRFVRGIMRKRLARKHRYEKRGRHGAV